MKSFAIATIMLLSVSAQAAPVSSAFTFENKLFVTILADCNNHGAVLEVEPSCRNDRMTTDYTTECKATVQIESTRMGCPDVVPSPKTFMIHLKASNVTEEATTLILNVNQDVLEVGINK
ncbi:MAG: hypothetical protein V4692_03700 [Bdellovibrionota bacterium]